ATVLALMTELRQELAVLSEFQDVSVVRSIPADPDITLVINGDPVVRLRPFVALPRTAPVPDQVTGLIELENGRRLRATCAGLRISGGFIRRERVGPMNNPDVVLSVNPHADGHPDVPVVRQRLRPHRIDFEPGRHDHGFPLNGRHLLQHALTDEQRGEEHEKARADVDITVFFHTLYHLKNQPRGTRGTRGYVYGFLLRAVRHRRKEHRKDMFFVFSHRSLCSPWFDHHNQIEIRLIPFFINFWLKLSK